MAFIPSEYQTRIFDWVSKGTGNAVVKAVAGSGKSTTLVEALDLMKGKVLFCAFNKHIAEELSRQLTVRNIRHVDVKTLHGFGNSTVRKAVGSFALNDQKYRDILKERAGESYWDKTFKTAVLKLTELVRMTLTDWHDAKAVELLSNNFDIDTNSRHEDVLKTVPLLLDEGLKLTTMLDFADMIWFPNVLKLPVARYDWVCVDEVQDLNKAQRELVLKAGRGGRVLAVGDEKQSIYGWSGADTQSVPKFVEALKAVELPLSICYRCPKSHVELAKKLVPEIEARPDAPEGDMKRVTLDEAVKLMDEKDMVICRVNAPLARIALGLIRSGKKAMIRGRDIGKGLTNLIEKHAIGPTFEDALKALVDYRDAECLRLERLEKEQKADSLRDRVDTIMTLADGLRSMDALEARIEAIFADERSGVVCSSVHRAKGLQADRVFVYRPELMEYFTERAKTVDAKQQEKNVTYISLTRAKQSLFFVERGDEPVEAYEGAQRYGK